MTTLPDNWFYCNHCKCISYDYKCECLGTYCNAGGCDKYRHLYKLVVLAKKVKNHPPIKELKKRTEYNKEDELLKKIFGPSVIK